MGIGAAAGESRAAEAAKAAISSPFKPTASGACDSHPERERTDCCTAFE